MATKKTPLTEDDAFAMPTPDTDFDQAVDDLRGVLKNDAEGTLPDIGSDFGSDLGSDFSMGAAKADPLSGFDNDFGGAALGGPSSDFGGSSFGDSDFGGSSAPSQEPGSALTANLDLIMDIPIDVQIVLGSSRMQVSGLMSLEEGAIIALDKKIGEPVEIMVNGRRIARGEITVLENDDTRFGVKLIEVMSTKIS
ncbi:flagellar motor switch protein FliN [Rhizobium sp. S95]|uniref:Flagellar motor switch protein FliN n=1 Tax=Ciceribacter sichuanensis TaxID=2949647 RepID=A0AAJ1C1F0_9HYPH|nr:MULTISPECIES: flagellar motor switch protein FliN [unclassified Ciceribacter]MCM2396100.1 flagellar motor switch protein FliN [Ciceribacter sp. S95]MCM2401087.1 flagellar motor switch protein FliN [Ciceribacter sp. S153]MCO5959957.1 flagellar motor switch protein FliN [Ciceribacter sp. S101]